MTPVNCAEEVKANETALSVLSDRALGTALPQEVAENAQLADLNQNFYHHPSMMRYCPFMSARGPILIADDEPLLTEMLEFRLQSMGFETITAHDGREALVKFAEAAPAAVVLDAMMPVHDGMEVLRRIRASEAGGSVPIIMLSARRNEDDIVRALEAGASDYIVKPFLPEELVVRLRRLLAGRA